MRHVRIMFGLAAVVCMCAVAAIPASAHQFTASAVKKAFPLKTQGVGVGTQSFKFGKIEVECGIAKAKGSIAESPAPLLKVEVRIENVNPTRSSLARKHSRKCASNRRSNISTIPTAMPNWAPKANRNRSKSAPGP